MDQQVDMIEATTDTRGRSNGDADRVMAQWLVDHHDRRVVAMTGDRHHLIVLHERRPEYAVAS